jgi:hypothetical protein
LRIRRRVAAAARSCLLLLLLPAAAHLCLNAAGDTFTCAVSVRYSFSVRKTTILKLKVQKPIL